jgi:hypothetical protein
MALGWLTRDLPGSKQRSARTPTTSQPSVSRLSRKFGILDVTQPQWASTACYKDSFAFYLWETGKLSRCNEDLQSGRQGSIPGISNIFFPTPLSPNRLWGLPNLMWNGYRRLLPKILPSHLLQGSSALGYISTWIWRYFPPKRLVIYGLHGAIHQNMAKIHNYGSENLKHYSRSLAYIRWIQPNILILHRQKTKNKLRGP